MEKAKRIFLEGEYHVEPLIVDRGEERIMRVVLEAGAKLHATAFVLGTGGEAAKLVVTIDLAGEGAEFHLHALYLASDRAGERAGATGASTSTGATGSTGTKAGRADIDVTVNHLVPGCTSRQLIKGIATDSATGSFTGMVHVAPGAQRTDAAQRNQNLQLTDTAHVLTRPGLEIYADDVSCSHGATIGRLDEEAVYYMRQRGVSEAEARRMQMQGFAGEIVDRCPSEEARHEIGERISALIDSF